MKFIKIHSVAPNSVNDTVVYLSPKIIATISEASAGDKSQREQVNAMVETMVGHRYGCSESAQEILAQLEDFPGQAPAGPDINP